MCKRKETLMFVYNAETGLYNKLIDFAHKSLKPSTYSCSLCQLTYGHFSAKPEWTQFLGTLGLDVKFLYKDELKDSDYEYPIVLLEDDKGIASVLIDNERLQAIETLEELIKEVKLQLS